MQRFERYITKAAFIDRKSQCSGSASDVSRTGARFKKTSERAVLMGSLKRMPIATAYGVQLNEGISMDFIRGVTPYEP